MDSAKLFQNGQSQAVRLPKEYRFHGNEVFIKKAHNAVILIPKEDSWRSFVESLNEFTEDYMSERSQPPLQEREGL